MINSDAASLPIGESPCAEDAYSPQRLLNPDFLKDIALVIQDLQDLAEVSGLADVVRPPK